MPSNQYNPAEARRPLPDRRNLSGSQLRRALDDLNLEVESLRPAAHQRRFQPLRKVSPPEVDVVLPPMPEMRPPRQRVPAHRPAPRRPPPEPPVDSAEYLGPTFEEAALGLVDDDEIATLASFYPINVSSALPFTFGKTPKTTDPNKSDASYLSSGGQIVPKPFPPRLPVRNPLRDVNPSNRKRRSLSTSGRLQNINLAALASLSLPHRSSDDNKTIDQSTARAGIQDKDSLSLEASVYNSHASDNLSLETRSTQDIIPTMPLFRKKSVKQPLGPSSTPNVDLSMRNSIKRTLSRKSGLFKPVPQIPLPDFDVSAYRLPWTADDLDDLRRFHAAGFPGKLDPSKHSQLRRSLSRVRLTAYNTLKARSQGLFSSSTQAATPQWQGKNVRLLDPPKGKRSKAKITFASVVQDVVRPAITEEGDISLREALRSVPAAASRRQVSYVDNTPSGAMVWSRKMIHGLDQFADGHQQNGFHDPAPGPLPCEFLDPRDHDLLHVLVDEGFEVQVVLILETLKDKEGKKGGFIVECGTLYAILGELLAPVYLNRSSAATGAYEKLLVLSIPLIGPELNFCAFLVARLTEAQRIKSLKLQMAVLTTLHTWLDSKPEDALTWDADTVDTMVNTATNSPECIKDLHRQLEAKLLRIHDHKAKQLEMLSKTSQNLSIREELRSLTKPLYQHTMNAPDVVHLDETTLAHYLAAVDLILFRQAIKPKNVQLKLEAASGKGTYVCPMEERAKMIQHWMYCKIFNTTRPDLRANVIGAFIKVAQKLCSLGDLQGTTTIIQVLTGNRFNREDLKVTWQCLDRDGLSSLIPTLNAHSDHRKFEYEATRTDIKVTQTRPWIPNFTGPGGLWSRMLEEHESRFQHYQIALNKLEGRDTKELTADKALWYKWDLKVLAAGELLDLSNYRRLWEMQEFAEYWSGDSHVFGSIGRSAYVMQLFEPAQGCWGADNLEPRNRNKQLEGMSLHLEQSIMSAWQTIAPHAEVPIPTYQAAYNRNVVVDVLHRSAVEEESSWI